MLDGTLVQIFHVLLIHHHFQDITSLTSQMGTKVFANIGKQFLGYDFGTIKTSLIQTLPGQPVHHPRIPLRLSVDGFLCRR